MCVLCIAVCTAFDVNICLGHIEMGARIACERFGPIAMLIHNNICLFVHYEYFPSSPARRQPHRMHIDSWLAYVQRLCACALRFDICIWMLLSVCRGDLSHPLAPSLVSTHSHRLWHVNMIRMQIKYKLGVHSVFMLPMICSITAYRAYVPYGVRCHRMHACDVENHFVNSIIAF